MIKHGDMNGVLPDMGHIKRSYSTPALMVFGQVAALTCSASAPCQGDNVACTTTGGTSMSMQASDANAKVNIVRIGDHPLGMGLYLFDYKAEYCEQWGAGRQFGVMAQEVESLMPEAVCIHPDGYKMVNYAMLGITHTVH